MGSSTDIMHDFALKEIRGIFSSYDGWKYNSLASNNGDLYRISRHYRAQNQNIYLGVSFDAAPSQECLTNLLASGETDRFNKGVCLVVPSGADVSDVPGSVRIFFLTSFGFVNGELRWLTKKKNAMRFAAKPIAA